MARTMSFGVHQMKVKPRPLVGTKTFIRETQRDMRNREWSEGTGGMFVEALLDNEREKILANAQPSKTPR